MSNLSPLRQPAGVPTGGQFAATGRAENGIGLGEPQAPTQVTMSPAPLSDRDRAVLVEWRGQYVHGYDSDDINRLFAEFDSATVVCVWATFDDYGYGGDSEFAGWARVPDPDGNGTTSAVQGPMRQVHPQVVAMLSDPECPIDPNTIPSLLSDEKLDVEPAMYELCNMALENDQVDTCAECGQQFELDGDGYDGLCPGCADKVHGQGR